MHYENFGPPRKAVTVAKTRPTQLGNSKTHPRCEEKTSTDGFVLKSRGYPLDKPTTPLIQGGSAWCLQFIANRLATNWDFGLSWSNLLPRSGPHLLLEGLLYGRLIWLARKCQSAPPGEYGWRIGCHLRTRMWSWMLQSQEMVWRWSQTYLYTLW